MNALLLEKLFSELYFSKTEDELYVVIQRYPDIFKQDNWYPLGNNQSNFGVIENQQSSPIAALIEKITNSIDAILMRKCFEKGIDPKSNSAPKSMEEAINVFFDKESKSWDLTTFRKKQAENIQIIADGPKMNTSLVIYDDGEGQHPEDFERTFLSLLTGNKNEIHFVQGKYNMGGSGAIVFCGKRSFQLIASKKFDNKGDFGFTIIREHPLTKEEEKTKKNTWYEYLKIDNKIPSFSIGSLDLKLHNRNFTTGTIVKLYSYDLPSGSRSVISRDLNQSINEFLFEPALPVLTVDKKERYPDDRNLERELFGLKRRLEQDDSKYIEDFFSEKYDDELFGKMKVTSYVFRSKIDDRGIKETRETIQREFFKNNMAVLFSINGQVHGHFSSEFITRSLKLNLLKNHLIIHVDCTDMNYNFRKELFMASRDRLKDGDETRKLRDFLARKLSAKSSPLVEIEKKRKENITVDSGDTKELLKSFTKNLPINSELLKLIDQTFKIEQKNDHTDKKDKETIKRKEEKEPFKPERFPSIFKLKSKGDGETDIFSIPQNGEKIIKFDTDVENHYFDRVEAPGELKIAVLGINSHNATDGGTDNTPNDIENYFNVNTSSPKEGKIKVSLNPKKELKVGDAAQIKVTLTSPGNDIEQMFWVKVSEPEAPKENAPKEEKQEETTLGLPEHILVYNEKKDNALSWEDVETATNNEMNYKTVMVPMVKGENLEKIFINMESSVLLNYKSKYRNANEEQIKIADNKYIASVYFHTLFLYTITKNRRYKIFKDEGGNENLIELDEYLKDLFDTYYSEFILNFGGMNEMMQGLSD